MIYVLFWIALGGLCAVIAPSRGRSAVAWFFIGAAFSVFGLIALLALPSLHGRPATLHQPPDIRSCPHCAEEIKRAAKVCKHCGRDVEDEAPTTDVTLARDPAPSGEAS